MLQLARDVLEVAEPVLLHSPVLTPADCDAIIEERGVCYADILSRRSKPAPVPEPVPVAPEPLPAAVPPIESTRSENNNIENPQSENTPTEEVAPDDIAAAGDAPEPHRQRQRARAVRIVLRGRQRRAAAHPPQSRICGMAGG